MAEAVVLKVKMSCQGCSGAVKRVLDKMEGVDSYEINMEEQKVTVKGSAKAEDIFQTVSKTGKKTEFWREEAEPKEAPEVAAPPVAAAATAEASPPATAAAAEASPPATAAAAEAPPPATAAATEVSPPATAAA